MKSLIQPIKIASSFVCVAAGLSFAFTNCSKVDFGATQASKEGVTYGDDGEPVTQPPVAEAIKNCADAQANGKIRSSKQKIDFEDTRIETGRQKVCRFNDGSNLEERNNYLQARHEQSENLNLPAGAVICGVQMKTAVQNFKYDDVFFLTFNNRILASNLARSVVLNSVEPLPLTSGPIVPLYKYDWLKVRGASFEGVNDKADDYCLGAKEGQASCQWPLSQKSGTIQFSFQPEMLIHIGLKANSSDQRFGFTITGDNDPSDDCYHEHLNFEMTVSYYVQ